ncbi:MAG: hypothetical protein HQK73_12950 [Desulfamplus sp.]|nr:hypothetical protein [Desulfamplus sp.]
MPEKILPITQEEFMSMKVTAIDDDKDEALRLIKLFIKRIEIQDHKGMKSHLHC